MTQVVENTEPWNQRMAKLRTKLGWPTIEQEVATLLKKAPDGVSAAELAKTIRSAKTFADDAEDAGRAARLKSVDPRCVDAIGERSRAEDQEFVAMRLKNAVEALTPHYEAAVKKEQRAQWAVDTQDIRLRIDALSKELQGTYKECVDKLIDVFQRCETINHEARQFASAAPPGCGLGSVEGSDRIRDVILPQLGSSRGAEPEWPPKQVPFGVGYAASVAAMMSSARLPTESERIAEAKRVTDFYAAQEAGRIRKNEEAEAKARAKQVAG
jgi:hypothetical protein